jgi:hypothetical protein
MNADLLTTPSGLCPLAMREVVTLRVTDDFCLSLRFRDGLIGEVDCRNWITSGEGPMIQPLKDPAFFEQVFLDHGALTWPNGYDLCPDTVRQWAMQGYCD